MPLGHNVLIPRQSFLAAKYPTKGWSLADLEKVALPYSDRQSSTLLHFCSLSAKCQRVVGYFEVCVINTKVVVKGPTKACFRICLFMGIDYKKIIVNLY